MNPSNHIFISNKFNVLGEAITQTVGNVKPASNTVIPIYTDRQGLGQIEITGDYTGINDTLIDIQILSNGNSTQISEAIPNVAGNQEISGISIDNAATIEDFEIVLADLGIETINASLDFYGVALISRLTGNDGNGITISVDDSGIVRTDTVYSLLDDLPANTDSEIGPQYDFEAYPLDSLGRLSDDTKRYGFKNDRQVFRTYSKPEGTEKRYYFDPPPLRTIPAETVIQEVTGSYTVTVEKAGYDTETYTVVTLYDLLKALKSRSKLLSVDGIVTEDKTPGGMAVDDLQAVTSPYLLPYTVSGSEYAKQLNTLAVTASASYTEILEVKCIDNNIVGSEVWKVTGTRSGKLPNAVTNTAYNAGPVTFVIPKKVNDANQQTRLRFVETRPASGHDENNQIPPICMDLLTPGKLAQDMTITLTWTKRPGAGCACDDVTYTGNLDLNLLGLSELPGGISQDEAVNNQYEQVTRDLTVGAGGSVFSVSVQKFQSIFTGFAANYFGRDTAYAESAGIIAVADTKRRGLMFVDDSSGGLARPSIRNFLNGSFDISDNGNIVYYTEYLGQNSVYYFSLWKGVFNDGKWNITNVKPLNRGFRKVRTSNNGSYYIALYRTQSTIGVFIDNLHLTGYSMPTSSAYDGIDIAISGDGLTAAIYYNGEIKVYTRSGSTWSLSATITASETSEASAIRINDAGDRIYQYYPNDNGGFTLPGTIAIYALSGTWSLETELSDPSPENNQSFGRYYDISGDGNTIFATSKTGSQYRKVIYNYSGSWSVINNQNTSNRLLNYNGNVDGTKVIATADATEQAEQIFYYNSSNWNTQNAFNYIHKGHGFYAFNNTLIAEFSTETEARDFIQDYLANVYIANDFDGRYVYFDPGTNSADWQALSAGVPLANNTRYVETDLNGKVLTYDSLAKATSRKQALVSDITEYLITDNRPVAGLDQKTGYNEYDAFNAILKEVYDLYPAASAIDGALSLWLTLWSTLLSDSNDVISGLIDGRDESAMETAYRSDIDAIEAAIEGGSGWTDQAGLDYWTVETSLQDIYRPAFTNLVYHSVKSDSNGIYSSSQEFAFVIKIAAACQADLIYGDQIILKLDRTGSSKTYEIDDSFRIPIVAASPIVLSGGVTGNDQQTYAVSGSVTGIMADYVADKASPSSYVSQNPASDLDFTISYADYAPSIGDRFTLKSWRNQYQYRQDSGSWSSAADIPATLTALVDGLNVEFKASIDGGFVDGDIYSYQVLQPGSGLNVLSANYSSWLWSNDSSDYDFVFDVDKTVNTVGVAHTLPENAVVNVIGYDDLSAEVFNVNLTAGKRNEPLVYKFDSDQTIRRIYYAVSNATDGGINWLFACKGLTPSAPPSNVEVTRVYRMNGQSYNGSGSGGSISWDNDKDWLRKADIDSILDMIDYQKQNDNEPIILLLNGIDPVLVEIESDTVNVNEYRRFEAGIDKRLYGVSFDFKPAYL